MCTNSIYLLHKKKAEVYSILSKGLVKTRELFLYHLGSSNCYSEMMSLLQKAKSEQPAFIYAGRIMKY